MPFERLNVGTFARSHVHTCLLCVAAVLLVALVGCGRMQRNTPQAEDGLTVTLTAEPSPPAVGQGVVVVGVRDAAGQPVAGLRIEAEGNMSHAGMKPSLGRAEGGQDGSYRVPLAWTMAGDWYVDVKLIYPDGRVVTRRFPLTVR